MFSHCVLSKLESSTAILLFSEWRKLGFEKVKLVAQDHTSWRERPGFATERT